VGVHDAGAAGLFVGLLRGGILSLDAHHVRYILADAEGTQPTGGVNENNMLDYLSFPKILCCGGSWMVPKDAVENKDWAKITELTRSGFRACGRG